MKNKSFYVLHLSDLHIRNEGQRKTYYSDSLKKLINDINKQTQNLKNIIIVISGDIIDQGDYETNSEAAKKFFVDLHDCIKERVCDIIIVPGNHDKHRDPINSLISIAHIEKNISDENEFAKVEWEKQLEAYKDFFSLRRFIRELFGKKDEDEKDLNSFGTDVVEVVGYNICFLRIDSAWCSYSAKDYRKLRVGNYQLKKLYHDYNDLKNQYDSDNKSIDLTVAISHYPLNWLNATEEELCNNYFMSDRFLDVDVLMCGHVHDFSVVNHFNHEHSLLTLVTGIGWQAEKPKEERNIHRYSIYTFNLAFNSCDITMRKTKSNGDFDYDYSVYIGTTELKENKLRYPLKVKKSASFIKINTIDPIEAQGLFVNKSILSLIPKVASSIVSFSDSISRLYDRYKDNLLSCFIEEYLPEDWITMSDDNSQWNVLYSKIYDYLYEDEALSLEEREKYLSVSSSFNDFLSFLYDICVNAVEELKEIFSAQTFLRAHFRWHNYSEKGAKTTRDIYPMLCQYSNLPDDQKRSTMQDIPWGGLIKAAFVTQEPIVFSANRQYNPIHTSWNDFITLIPFFNDSSHDIRVKKGLNERRPIVSFGISLKGETYYKEDVLVLHLLAYLRFDKIIGRIIDEYIRLFNIDTRTFIKKAQEIMNKSDQEEHSND